MALNAPIQGTAADIIKRAMARIGPALAAEGLTGTKMLMQVHDELVFDVLDAAVRVSRQLQHLLFSSAIYYSLQRITREVGESLYTPAGPVGIPNLRG
jgi:DNA polymerase I-like protein with 3'-5' exonuclease and polymerase domains